MSLTVHLIGKSRTDDEGLPDAEAMVRRDLLEQHGLCCQAQAPDRSPTERSGPDRGRSDHPAARGGRAPGHQALPLRDASFGPTIDDVRFTSRPLTGPKNGTDLSASIANYLRHRFGRNRLQRARGHRAVPRSRRNMQYPVLQFPLLQHLAGMLGDGKRHRGLQSRPLRSGATLPRTPLIERRLPSRARHQGWHSRTIGMVIGHRSLP
jgi:hypothetical protein